MGDNLDYGTKLILHQIIMRLVSRLATVVRVSCRSYHFDLLSLKVGYIEKVNVHPLSDKLYVSQIKLGPNGPVRQVCSGLREFLPRESLSNQLVIVVNNMKKCKLRGEASEAMILCGDDSQSVQLCKPRNFDESLVGANVVLEGSSGRDPTTRIVKRKEWEDISSRLCVGDHGNVIYKEAGEERQLYVEGTCIPIVVEDMPKGSPVK